MNPKIIVLDDDPTGSQTVHSCLLLTVWDVDTLRLGLTDESPIFFILTNTRSLTPEQAASVTREVCQNLKSAIASINLHDYLIVSRSDSTLRGHYPIETDVIAEELEGFDAHFLVPAFFEGGRITIDSVHYLIVDGVPIPVHETEFARDSVFSYSHSYLPDYVAEKTHGRIPANTVERFLLGAIRTGFDITGKRSTLERLMKLTDNKCVVVDGEVQEDLNIFAREILKAASNGKRFLFRSAASILTALADLPPQSLPAEEMSQYVRNSKPGAFIVGSHVKKTTDQLQALLKETGIVGIEIDVAQLLSTTLERSHSILTQALNQIQTVHEEDKTPVIYTSRQELAFADVQARLQFGADVSNLLMDIVRGLPSDIGYLVSKGGITSNDVLSKGLALTSARLLGQILAGCSMVVTPVEHPQFANLPVVLFPGNVGDTEALATIYHRLTSKK